MKREQSRPSSPNSAPLRRPSTGECRRVPACARILRSAAQVSAGPHMDLSSGAVRQRAVVPARLHAGRQGRAPAARQGVATCIAAAGERPRLSAACWVLLAAANAAAVLGLFACAPGTGRSGNQWSVSGDRSPARLEAASWSRLDRGAGLAGKSSWLPALADPGFAAEAMAPRLSILALRPREAAGGAQAIDRSASLAEAPWSLLAEHTASVYQPDRRLANAGAIPSARQLAAPSVLGAGVLGAGDDYSAVWRRPVSVDHCSPATEGPVLRSNGRRIIPAAGDRRSAAGDPGPPRPSAQARPRVDPAAGRAVSISPADLPRSVVVLDRPSP
jgi:hypothetical protein